MIPHVRGPTLEIEALAQGDSEWFFRALSDREVLDAFALEAPSREAFAAGRLSFGGGGSDTTRVRNLVARRRADGAPHAIIVEQGWDSDDDPIREIDVATPDPRERSTRLFFEIYVLTASALFVSGAAKRLRVRLLGHGARAPIAMCQSWGGVYVGALTDRSGAASRFVYDVFPSTLFAAGSRARRLLPLIEIPAYPDALARLAP